MQAYKLIEIHGHLLESKITITAGTELSYGNEIFFSERQWPWIVLSRDLIFLMAHLIHKFCLLIGTLLSFCIVATVTPVVCLSTR